MVTENRPILRCHLPAEYSIHVQGDLDERWSEFLDGLVIQPLGAVSAGKPPVIIISGVISDQSSLINLLNKLCSLGMLVLYVKYLSYYGHNQMDKL